MTNRTPIQRTTFNGGEIAPELRWRSDLQRYANSCLALENAYVTTFGAAKRRPGTRVLTRLGTSVADVRLIPFRFNESTFYLVALVNRSGTVKLEVYDTTGTKLEEFATAYPAASLRSVQFIQSFDVLFLAHPEVPIMRLERLTATDFDFKAHTFRGGPYQDENAEAGREVRYYGEPHSTSVALTWLEGTYVCEPVTPAIFVEDTATASALSSHFERTVEISNNGTTRVYRVYKTIKIKGTISDTAKFGEGSALRIRTNGSAPFTFLEAPVAGIDQNDGTTTLTSTNYWVYLHSNAFTEYTQTLPAGTPVAGTTNESGYLTWTTPRDSWELPRLDTKRKFYKCLDTNSGSALSTVADWLPIDAYRGRVWAFSLDGFDLFEEEIEGAAYRSKSDRNQEISGRFRFNSPNIEYAAGIADDGTFAVGKISNTFSAYGTIRFRTEGATWKGSLLLETSTDGGESWETLATITSENNRNGSVEREISKTGTICRVRMETMAATGLSATNNNQCHFYVEIVGSLYNEFEIADVLLDAGIFAELDPFDQVSILKDTIRWSIAAFNERDGYPRALTIHEERLVLAATEKQATTIWGSQTNDFEQWQEGALETDAITFTIASDTFSGIKWLLSKQDMLIGTESGEWTLGSRSSEKVLSASTVSARRHSEYGSSTVQPVLTTEVAMFVERSNRRLRGMVWSIDSDSYTAADLTAFARHVGSSGLVELAYQRVPDSILWCLTGDGTLASLTYDRQNEVLGWARHDTGDEVTSICTTPGFSGGADLVWMVVQRGTNTFLEYLDADGDGFVDWRTTATHGTRVASVALPTGSTLGTSDFIVVADGNVLAPGMHFTFAANTVTIAAELGFTRVDVGAKYTTEIEPTAFAWGDGQTQGAKFQTAGVDLYVLDSFGGELSANGGTTWEALVMAGTSQIATSYGSSLGVGVELFTGRLQVKVGSGHVDELAVKVRTDAPFPFTLAAIGTDSRRN